MTPKPSHLLGTLFNNTKDNLKLRHNGKELK